MDKYHGDKLVPPEFENELNNIAIDDDGVIHDSSKGWHDGTCYGQPLPGSLEAIKKLSKNFNIIIFTARSKSSRPLVNNMTGTELVSDWLKKHDVLDCVKEITSEKPRAQIYSDDKGYRFKDWESTFYDLDKILKIY